MFYIGIYIFFLAAITVIFLSIGFFTTKKSNQLVFKFIGFFFFLLTIIAFFNKNNYTNKRINEFIGLYKFDSLSRLPNLDSLKQFKTLTLLVKENGEFVFNQKNTLFPSTIGNWEFHDTEDEGYIYCTFPGIKRQYLVSAWNRGWTFNGDINNVIFFTKISD
jgi:hypothetical protein